MVQERDEYVFICLIRRDADLLVLSMMSEFLRVPKQIREHAVSGRKVSFELTSAEKYTVPSEVDRCYFFNPVFCWRSCCKVLAGIYESYYEKPREILLMFYYPSEEYLGCLMTEEQLMFYDEINTEDLFEGKNDREKILIFSVD